MESEDESSTGKRFSLRKVNRHKDQFAPFKNLFGFTSDTSHYNGTLFRFPFRRTSYHKTFSNKELKSKISDKIFTAEGAERELFDTLCEEAAHLLLFLKSIESVELYTWDPAEKKKKLFIQISLSDSCLPHVRQFRKTCQNSCLFDRSTTILATCCVCLLSQSTRKQFNWLLCSTVGSSDAKLLELAAKLKVTPWSAVAAPLPLSVTVECIAKCHLVTPQMNSETVTQTLSQHFRTPAEITDDWRPPKEQEIGYPFCFLPLKDPTGLPVQVHGYFRVSSNRRSIEWPSPGDTGEQAIWNRHLVQTSLVPSYAILLAAKSFLFTYSRSLTDKVYCDPYSWWPLDQEIRNSPVWRDILDPVNLLPFICGLKLFWSPSNGGQWIKGSDAVLVTESTPPLIARLLISFGCPIVNPPTPVKETFNSLKDVDVLKEVTPQYVREQLKKVPSQCLRDLRLLVAVLEYIVSDLSNNYSVLEGLHVIPLANSESAPVSFCRSDLPWITERLYLVTDPDVYKLLSNLKDKMVSPDLPDHLTSIFRNIARSGEYTLAEATPEEICPQLISESMRKWIGKLSQRVQWTPGRNGMPGKDWLKLLWKWTQKNSVSLLELKGLPIIPLQSIDVATLSSLELVSTDSNLFCLRRPAQSGSIPEEVYRIAQTLGCTLIDHSSIFVHHTEELEQLLPTMTPQSLLSKMRSMPCIINQVVSLANADKNILRTFLFQVLLRRHQGVWGYLKSFISTPHGQLSQDLYLDFFKSLPFYAVGVGASSISYVSLSDPSVIFPPNDTSNFPSDVHFPDKVLRVLPSERIGYNILLKEPDSHSCFITRCASFALNLTSAMKTKAFIWILKQYRSIRDEDVREFLCGIKFLPSMDRVWRRADQLYDPEDKMLKHMFFDSQYSFPASEFQSFLPELREIGLLTWQSVKDNQSLFENFITDRARAIARSLPCHYDKAKECSKNILKALLIRDNHSATFLSELKETNFFACEANPPQNYPSELRWAGKNCFLSPVSMCTGGKLDQMAHLVGSSMPVGSSEYLDTIAQLYPKPAFKGFFKTNEMYAVCKHLTNIVSLPEKVCQRCGHYITEMMEDVYRYLNKNLSAINPHLTPRTMWHEQVRMFLPINMVAKETDVGVSLTPYLYSLKDIPGALRYGELWNALGIKVKHIPSDYCKVLEDIQKETVANDRTLSDHQVTMVVHILQFLHKQSFSGSVLMPTADGRLLSTHECTYDDRNLSNAKQGLLNTRKDITFTHRDIPKAIANYFKVPPISSKIAKPRGFRVRSNVHFKGQEIPLTRRISNIIKDYEDRIDVFKELIQNADDAGATEVKFLIDWREHPTKDLMSAGMKHWQGPALYAYNDSVFTDEDFDHICKVEGGTKLNDPTKIGRFGLGFCCTYQLTDVPSFVSRRQFVVFDPHLDYLGECAPNQTGIMIDYVSETTDMMSFYKDQLVPFQDVFGCNVLNPSSDGDGGYPHTLFRFPFRTKSTPRSDICGKVFDEATACEWKESFKTSAEKMLVFLRHVNKVELYEVKRGSIVAAMKCVCSVTSTIEERKGSPDLVQEYRLSLQQSSQYQYSMPMERKGMKIKRVLIKVFKGSDNPTSKKSKGGKVVSDVSHQLWMVSSVLGSGSSLRMACSFYGRSKGLVPLAEVAVKVRREGSLLLPKPCTGQVFCFLPLPVSTDQKCLINGYFEVSTSRRNLLHLQAGRLGEKNDDHQWNRCLIQDALSEAFGDMLTDLQTYNSDCIQLPDSFLNSYYHIWPILDSQDDISRELKGEFKRGQLLSANSRPLFYTQSCEWCSCKAVSVLSKAFRTIFTKAVPDAVTLLTKYGNKRVALDVPEDILTMLQGNINAIEPMMYIRDVLLPNLEQIGDDDKEMRDKQIRLLLQRFKALESEDEGLTRLMRRHCCIPTEPHGTLKKPVDLIDSSSPQLAGLFDVDEERFPLKDLLHRKVQAQTLRQLGMAEYTLSDADVIDRAKTVQVIVSENDVKRAKTRSERLQDYMTKRGYLSSHVKKELEAIPFLPVKQRPPNISVPWCGDSHFGASSQMYDEKYMDLIFTTGVVADCKSDIYGILQFHPPPIENGVICHLNTLHEWEKSHSPLHEENKAFISKSIDSVYTFLDQSVRQIQYSYLPQPVTNIYLDSVWDDSTGTFVQNRKLSLTSPINVSLAPYRLTKKEIPALRKHDTLWTVVKISQCISVQDFIDILAEMSVSSEPLNKEMITGIFQFLLGKLSEEQKRNVLLPTTMSTLVPSNQCYYDDRHWNEYRRGSHLLKKYTFVDSLVVSQPLAEYFGVCPISSKLGNPEGLKMKYERKGQRIPVSRRINRILREYKEINDVFKELIQNADDAGATEVKFLIDRRQHPMETLFQPEMQHLQGPALYAYNNSVFSDEDFQNICELEGATKKDKPTKIGRFGLGFCATFHLTDVPSFVSRDKVVFLDPQKKYLNKVTPEGGVRFNFVSERAEIEEFYQDQLLPFHCVFGCMILGSKDEYNGTLFRFPFRTVAQSDSEISKEIFDARKINDIKESFMSTAHLLPVFLQHVKKIELWEMEGKAKDPRSMKLVLSVERDTPRSFQPLEVFKDYRDSGSLPQYSATQQFSVTTKRMGMKTGPTKKAASKNINSSTRWIVASALARPDTQSWNYACSHKNDGLVPLTEVAISTKGQSMIPNLHSTGHVYCFLPLPIVINDLPCMINGCFAVPSNRRTLEDLESEDQKTWNHFLIKEVLVEAYLSLLHYLTTTIPTEGAVWKESLAAYYKLWPIARLSHPVSKELRTGFLTALQSCQLPLAHIPLEQGQWLPVNEAEVLEVSFYSTVLSPIRNEVLKVLLDRGYKVVELTPDIRKSLTSESHSVVSTFAFFTYCHDVLLSNWDVDDAELRDNQLFHILNNYNALIVEYEWLEELLKTSPCVPCEPDGTRYLPTTLICPEGMLKELYLVEEGRFPQDRFFKSQEVKKTLVALGMSQYILKNEDLLDRARTIEDLPYNQAMERSNSYIRYLTAVHFRYLLMQKRTGTFSTHTIDNPVLHQLREIAFLPVQQQPKDTTIPWAGDKWNFAPPNSLYYSSFSHEAFTQGLILAKTSTDIEDLFMLKVPHPDNVVDHLEAIVSWVEELDNKCISEANAVFFDQAMPAVYNFLNKEVQPAKVYQPATEKGSGRRTLETRLSRLRERPCIWQRLGSEGRFLTPAQVVTSYRQTDCYPYLVKLSNVNGKYLPLFEVLGVKKVLTLSALVKVLQSIKDDMDGNPVPESMLNFIVDISSLCGQRHPTKKMYGMNIRQSEEDTKNWDKLTFFLPNEDGVMSQSNHLAYREASSSFIPVELSEGRTQYVHPRIHKRDAILLGVEDVLTNIRCEFQDNKFLKEVEFGQHEYLCTRLNNILSQYPCDVSIFKEFIQNAEDATASEIVFVVDHRNDFGEKSLIADNDSWKSLQRMRSLLVFNNRMFKEKDIESIKQLGIGGKGDSLDKIGRFGIGFNVAYHVTDCPMFVSYGEGGQAENFCVFDPNFHFVPKARCKQPGARYILKNVDGRNSSEHFQDQFAPFLGDIIPKVASTIEGCFDDYSVGWPSGFAVFRLPLTRSANWSSTHFITKLKKGHEMNAEDLLPLLRDLKSQAPSMLMFLSHLKRISVFQISKDGQIVDPWSVAVRLTEDGARKSAAFAQNVQKICSKICSQDGFATIPPSQSITYRLEVNVAKPDVSQCGVELTGTHTSSLAHRGFTMSQYSSVEDKGKSLNTCNPPKCWIISKRFGISDVPESLLYLAGDNHLFPIAGVAVPLTDQRSGEEFTGKLFTHLPLPLESGIPAHINAHFWVDQSRKHLENTGSGRTEPLKDWNKVLTQQVVSRAYLEVLLKCRDYVIKKDVSSEKWYYNLFLTTEGLSQTLDAYSFKDVIYQLLLEREAEVLLADELEQKDSVLKWLALTTNQQNPKKGWFFTDHSLKDVMKVLLSLGVQITVAPVSVNLTAMFVAETAMDTAYSGEVTPELARTYLRTPAQHCCVREDVIVPALVPLLQYVLSDISSPEECYKVDRLPLMLTSNHQFQPIDVNIPLYKQKFINLLPEHKAQYFISRSLTQHEFLGAKLTDLGLVQLVQPQFVAEHIKLVKQPVADLSKCDCSLLVNLWKYLAHIATTTSKSLDHFSQVAIIPTNQSTLVSVDMAKSVMREHGSVQLLKKLALPVVNFSVLSNVGHSLARKCTDLIRPRLAVESNPDEVLYVLQTALEQGQLQSCTDITESIAYEFIGFVQNSCDLNSYRKTLRRLAIYKMVTGEWQSLKRCQQVYALPQERVPHDGLKDIHDSCHPSLIEIQPGHTNFYEAVNIQLLTGPVDFYHKIIIPNFRSLSTEAMIAHLQYLTRNRMQDGYSDILEQLSEIRFIQEGRRSHCCHVSDYYDPDVPLLKEFLPDNSFPPPPWLEHLDLLRQIGLKTTVTDSLWIQFAKKLATLPESEAKQKSQLLLAWLQHRIRKVLFSDMLSSTISKTVTTEDRQNLVEFLRSIADIPFVPCQYPAEIDLLFYQLKGVDHYSPKFQLVCFSNSFFCEPGQAQLLCLTSVHPIVESTQLVGPCILTSEARKVFVNALSMKLPTTRDVCQNLLELSSVVDECTLSSKQSVDVTRRLQSLFTSLYNFICSKDLSVVKAELSDEKCLFSPSDDGTTFRISKGSELVRDHNITPRPYMKKLPCVPSYLRDPKYTSFLAEIGVASNITVEHFVHLLNTLHASDKSSKDPNRKECVKALYEDLVHFLRTSRNRDAIEYVHNCSCVPLPDEGMVLRPSHQLILNDAQWIKSRLDESSEYHFILSPPPPPGGGDITLPQCLKVKALSTLVYEELDKVAVLDRDNRCEGDLRAEVTQMEGEGGDVVQGCTFSSRFVHFLRSEEFGNGLKRLMSHSLNGKPLTREHLDSVEEVQGLEVKCVYAIRTTLKNSSTQSTIPGSEKDDVSCYLDEGSSPKCLYVRFHPKNGRERNVLLLQQVVRRLMRLLKRNVESAHLLALLESCDPEKIKQTLDCLEIKSYSSQDDEDASLLTEEEEGRGTVIEDFEYIMTCNFREDDLVKYCKADSETVVARVIKLEPRDDMREYPYPLKVHLKISSDDEIEVSKMNSLLVCRFLPQAEVARLKTLYGIQGSSNPSGLSEEKSIVLELPCGDQRQLRTYISTVLKTVQRLYSKEQVYFSIERLLFQLHFDCVHRHKQPEMFLHAIHTFLNEIERKLDYEENKVFLDSLRAKISTMKSQVQSQPQSQNEEEGSEIGSVAYSQISSWSVPPSTQQPVGAPTNTATIGHYGTGSTFQGTPVLASAPTGHLQHHRRLGGVSTNYPIHPGPARMQGGGAYIWGSGPGSSPGTGQMWPSSVVEPTPEPPPRVSMDDACVWLRDVSDTVSIVNHLCENTREIEVLRHDGEIERREAYQYPAAVCFYAHEMVLKCLKALFFAYCGLPGELRECSNLVELHQQLLTHGEIPQPVRDLEMYIHLVSGHGSTCCGYPSFDPPNTPNDTHSPIAAREVLRAAKAFLDGIQMLPEIQPYFSAGVDLPQPQAELQSNVQSCYLFMFLHVMHMYVLEMLRMLTLFVLSNKFSFGFLYIRHNYVHTTNTRTPCPIYYEF